MLEPLKGDELFKQVGGAFRLTALMQRRMKELVEGARPLVDTAGKTMVEIVLDEVAQNKICVDYDKAEMLDDVPGMVDPSELGFGPRD